MLILQNIAYRHPNKNLLFSGLDHSALHKEKVLCRASEINFAYKGNLLWENT